MYIRKLDTIERNKEDIHTKILVLSSINKLANLILFNRLKHDIIIFLICHFIKFLIKDVVILSKIFLILTNLT